MIPALLAATSVSAINSGGLTVTLAGGVASYVHTSSPYAGLKFDRDGKIYRNQSTSSANWSYYQDWISAPEATVGDGYEIRATYSGGYANPPNSMNSGLGSWLALSTDRAWEDVDNIRIGDIEVSTNMTIEIKPTGGSVEDSATYTLYALKVA